MSQLLNQTTSREISEWIAYFELEKEIEEKWASEQKAKKAKSDEALLKAKITHAGNIAALKKRKKYGSNKKR